jgi:anaerobic ribonucleoside-triphosphate reductase
MTDQTETPKPVQTEVKVPCEVYSRIVGYLRPVQNWNTGKKQEFKDRKTFVVKVEKDQ